jgi:MoaA/NifB/PqqE/SkfB family radical SAM enzyme
VKKKYVYSKFKIFHFPEKIFSLPKEKSTILPPVHIRIKPTNACNQHCYYCSYRADNLQLGKDMNERDKIPKEKMFEIIEDLEGMGVEAITFSGGGEPLIYPYILDTIKRIVKNRKLKFAFITNGVALKEEISELIAEYGSWVRISIDSWDSESYSKHRKVPKEQWDQVIKNIETFSGKTRKCSLGTYVIVDKNNVTHLFDMAKLFKEIGVHSLKISGVVVSDNAEENDRYHSGFFDKAKEEILKAKRILENENFEISDTYHYESGNFKKYYEWCPYLQIRPVIGADLNVYSCQDKAYNQGGLLGSIKSTRFRDFWLNNKGKFFKINPKVDCNHHCVANSQNEIILDFLNIYRDHLEFV